jgi:CHAD domain-containing protein
MDDAEDPRVRDGIELLIEERRTLREEEYLDLLEVISVTSLEDLQEKFTTAVDAALGQRDLFEPSSLSDAGRDVIAARLEDLTDLSPGIYEPFNENALHELRISAKRLRYATELFGNCWNGTVDPFAEEVTKMQSCLGEVHDCDVWIALMSKRLKGKGKAKRKNGSTNEAAAWLLSEFVKKRTKEYRSALELWCEWKANKFTERLYTTISQ